MGARVLFRADGGAKMGLGHVIRSIALMQMLKDDFDCSFLIREPSESLIRQIETAGGQAVALPATSDHVAEAVRISEGRFLPGDIVVVDGYHFNANYQKVIKERGCKLVAIDDMHENYFLADVVINHGGGLSEDVYACSTDTRLCLGPEFALLRPEFLRNEEAKKIIRSEGVAFVCLGGADPCNLSSYVTEKLLSYQHIRKVNLVVGSANLFYEELRKLAEKDPRVCLWRDVDAGGIVDLMRESAFAVVPASSVSYEVASTNTPMFVGRYVDNQTDLYHYLVSNQMAVGLGDFRDETLWEALGSTSSFEGMLRAQKRVFDGNSGKRLRKIFYELALSARSATPDDCQLYFDWANDPEVRANSLNTSPIPWENHQGWFSNRVNHPDHVFYLFFIGKDPVGQVRFDIGPENSALINYSLSKDFRGKGLGSVLLKEAIKRLRKERGVEKLTGIVKSSNSASSSVFHRLGFLETQKAGDLLEYNIDLKE